MMHQLRCLTIMQSASRDGDAAGDTHTGGGSAPTHDDAVARSSKRARTESGPSDAVVEASHSGATVLTDEQCYAKFRVLNPKFVYLVRSSRSSPRVAQQPQTVSSGGPYFAQLTVVMCSAVRGIQFLPRQGVDATLGAAVWRALRSVQTTSRAVSL